MPEILTFPTADGAPAIPCLSCPHDHLSGNAINNMATHYRFKDLPRIAYVPSSRVIRNEHGAICKRII